MSMDGPKKTLKEIRIGAGLTQLEFGRRLGYKNDKLVSTYERGNQPVPVKYLKKVEREFRHPEPDIVALRKTGYGETRAVQLNDQPAAPSNLATLRMLEDEKNDYAAALSWMIGRDTREGDEFAREVWNSKLSTTAKQLLLGTALREQERRARTATQKN